MSSTASTAARTATPKASASGSRSSGRPCARSAAASSSSQHRARERSCASSSTACACARGSRLDKILLVDDDPGVLDVVAFMLRREGFDVDEERDGTAALDKARTDAFDIVILDIMLPGMSGTDVCRALRAESDVPILMLTARDAEIDRVLGLELGADDYVTKPFSTAELLSRVRAILRRRELDRAT